MWLEAWALIGESCGARGCYQGLLGLQSSSDPYPDHFWPPDQSGWWSQAQGPPQHPSGATQRDVSVDLALKNQLLKRMKTEAKKKTPRKQSRS